MWQPIETAPKDGTRVLIFHLDEGDGLVVVSHWDGPGDDDPEKGWAYYGHRGLRFITADAWQPCPEPPEVEWTYTLKF